MKFPSLLPLSYVEYSLNGEIRPNVYYYFQFIVNSVKMHDETRILVHGIRIFNGLKSSQTIMHSTKLRPMFIGMKFKQKIIDMIGKLDEEIVFFPSIGKKITFNHIKPVYGSRKVGHEIKIPVALLEYFKKIHNPDSLEDVNKALEILYQYEYSAIHQTIKQEKRPGYPKDPVYSLPFQLSCEQEYIREEIFRILESPNKLCSLVHGDVGCGKTIIGYLAALKVVANGFKVLFLTPTIILASQVYKVFKSLNSGYNISLYTGKYKDLSGEIIIGTQALLFISIDNVGLVIIDEQHKFGTLQRQKITNDADLLMLSATPIPRTHYFAQSGKIKQFHLTNRSNNLVPYIIHSSNKEALLEKVFKGVTTKRIVIVCKTIALAEEMYEYCRKQVENCWLIHGKLNDKQEILEKFGVSFGILVSTTVIEVGVDLDIHVVIVDNADQFGLAQLHQLKGRAGRHSKISQCVFIGNNLEKLKLIKENPTGDQISQVDLELRGTGSIHQTNQSGKMFLFNKVILNNKLETCFYKPEIIPVSEEIVEFFMHSKNYI